MSKALAFGRLTVDQLRSYIALERDAGQMVEEVLSSIRTEPELLAMFSADLLPWYPQYELKETQQIQVMAVSFGLTPTLLQAVRQEDLHSALLAAARRDIPDSELDSPELRACIIKVFGLAIAIANTLDSLRVFGKWLNELVAEGRDGNDKAFFDAIRIDPTIICCESFAARLSRAVLAGDSRFIKSLQLALGGKTKKHESQLNRVRVALRFLVDANADGLPDDELENLFVTKLDLYRPGADGAKALRKHLRKQTKATTQKRRK